MSKPKEQTTGEPLPSQKKATAKDWITPEGLLLIEGWARDGLTDVQIATNIGIQRSTLFEWRKRFPELEVIVRKGKQVPDRLVENALLKRALGYEYDEVKRSYKELDGLTSLLEEVTVTHKVVQGDVTAQIIWLKHRKRQEWSGVDERGGGGEGVEDLTPLADMLRPNNGK